MIHFGGACPEAISQSKLGDSVVGVLASRWSRSIIPAAIAGDGGGSTREENRTLLAFRLLSTRR